jgi:hypothetical protein
MRKTFIALALVSATVAAPAVAQPYGGYGRGGYDQGYGQGYGRNGGHQIQQEINRLQSRIDRAAQRGRISRREAFSLQREAQGLERDFYRFSRNGLDRGEYRNLQVRLDRLQYRLREERRDGDGRRW